MAGSAVYAKGRRMLPNIWTYCRILFLKFGIRVAFFKFGKKPNFAEFRISNFWWFWFHMIFLTYILVFRLIQTSYFNLPLDRHSVFEIRYSTFDIRSVSSSKFDIRFRIFFLTFADLYIQPQSTEVIMRLYSAFIR